MKNKDNYLGNVIKNHRIAADMSYQKLADLVKTSKSYIFELETGKCKNPSIYTVKKIANSFGYTISEFLGEVPATINNGDNIRKLANQIIDLTK